METLNAQVLVKALTVASVGAGVTVLNCRPEAGKIWRILGAVGWQGAGANRNCSWFWTDAETPAGAALWPDISLAHLTALALFAPAANVVSLLVESAWSTNASYASFVFTAVGAAENAYARLLVAEYSGTGKM